MQRQVVRIIDGRAAHALRDDITGKARQINEAGGTTIVAE